MMRQDVLEDFRLTASLLDLKTGAPVVPSEVDRGSMLKWAAQNSFDTLLDRLFADAIALGIWRKAVASG